MSNQSWINRAINASEMGVLTYNNRAAKVVDHDEDLGTVTITCEGDTERGFFPTEIDADDYDLWRQPA